MNQAMLVPVVILSSIILLSAPVAVHTADDVCTSLNSTAACCTKGAKTSGCGWVKCKGDNATDIKGCYNMTNKATLDAACSNSTEEEKKDTCASEVPTSPCLNLNETTCCNGGDNKVEGCGLYLCDAIKKCWNASDFYTFKANCGNGTGTVNPKDFCSIDDHCETYVANTTCCDNKCAWFMCNSTDGKFTGDAKCGNVSLLPANITCQAPSKPTDTCKGAPPAPTTPTPLVKPCNVRMVKEDCCQNTSLKCQWVNCTGTEVCMIPENLSTCTNKENICAITTTTQAPTTPVPSVTTASNTGQHFDGASFIGGIILAVGVISIVFFVCKFYKNRKERNYHTL